MQASPPPKEIPEIMSLLVWTCSLSPLRTSSWMVAHMRSYSLWTLQPLGASLSCVWINLNLLGRPRGCLARSFSSWQCIWRPGQCTLHTLRGCFWSQQPSLQSRMNGEVCCFHHIQHRSRPWGLLACRPIESWQGRFAACRVVRQPAEPRGRRTTRVISSSIYYMTKSEISLLKFYIPIITVRSVQTNLDLYRRRSLFSKRKCWCQ